MKAANRATAPLSNGMPTSQAPAATATPITMATTVRIAPRGQNVALAYSPISTWGKRMVPRPGSKTTTSYLTASP